MKPIRDREARDRAAFSEENVAVTAGAGTGKTTLLVDAVMGRLLARGIPLRRILMLTFTEKAAAEMRIRLESRLRALLDPVTDEDRRDRARWDERARDGLKGRALAALAEIDRAEISTIHGFCAHFLREFPIEAGLVPSFAVDEGPKFDELFEREWGRWLDAELRADSPRRAEWLRVLAKAGLDDLREVAAGLSSFHVPDWALDPERAIEAGRTKLVKAVADLSGQLGSLATRHPGENNLKKQLIQVASYLQSPTPEGFEDLPHKASTAKSGWPPGTFDAAQDLMAEALPLAADLARLDAELLADALGLVSSFARSFRASFGREGWVGFDGLLMKARDLLASEEFPEVREQAKRKYDFVVVDEFQDTDPVQCEIALFLSEEGERRAPDAASVRLAKGKLFIVGDPKQSIYSFRGADIVAYERLKDRILEQGGRRERLETSFRSHSGILGTVNALFRTIIAKRGEVQPDYEEIFAVEGRDPKLPSQKVEALLFHGPAGRLSSAHAREAEGGAIADWIATSVGKLEIPDREPGSRRPLRLRDVAILLRALTDVHVLLDRLRSRGVRFVVEGEKFYYGTQEVIDFVNLLRAIADPHDAIALAGLLRSPLGASDDDALMDLVKRRTLDYRTPGPPGPVASLFALLRDLHGRHGRMTVPELIDEIFERTEVLELAGLSWHREQAVVNLLKMRQAAEAFEASGVEAPTLRGFLRRVSRDIREMSEEGESPLADEGLDAVRIMSIHKAKGLEFPVVFLPDLHRSSARRDDPPVRYDWPERVLGIRRGPLVDAGGAFLAHAWRRRAVEESKRVLYVAMTRARERLVLTGGENWRGACFLSELFKAIGSAGGPATPDQAGGPIKAGGLDLEVRKLEWKEPRRKESRARAGRRKKAPSWTALDRSWKRRETERVEASKRVRFTSPTALQESRVERTQVAADEAALSSAADTGTLCHLVLERLDFWNPDVDRLVKAGARELGIEDATEARAILQSFVGTEAFKTLAGAEFLARELPFLLPHDGGVMQGVIDLVARIDGRLTVIDYKSDRVEQPEKYAGQRKWYVEAAKKILKAKSPDFKLLYLRTGRFV
ncbi:MAG TPA: UvrD-helicase domain-containing protein [Planctomycetota bacterium]|nr:UvrD-helicase domain-containing protein [Planctomycetota bacterium]